MKCMKVLVHQQPYKGILRSFGLEKLFSLRWSSSSWFLIGLICLWIATLEVVLPNHTWNMIISSKPCFIIIKIKINQTLVSQCQIGTPLVPLRFSSSPCYVSCFLTMLISWLLTLVYQRDSNWFLILILISVWEELDVTFYHSDNLQFAFSKM